jgi:hypothetical protein
MRLPLSLLATAAVLPILFLFSGGLHAAISVATITFSFTFLLGLPIHLYLMKKGLNSYRYYFLIGMCFGVMCVFAITLSTRLRWGPQPADFKGLLSMIPFFSIIGVCHSTLFWWASGCRHEA